MTNKLRGEVELQLKGESYVLRPTFEALAGIETELNQGVLSLARKVASGEGVGVVLFTTIIYHGLMGASKDGESPLSRTRIGEILINEGIAGKIVVINKFLAGVLAGTQKSETSPKKDGTGEESKEA